LFVIAALNCIGVRTASIWEDGGFDGPTFTEWVMDYCCWIVEIVLRLQQTKGGVVVKKHLVRMNMIDYSKFLKKISLSAII